MRKPFRTLETAERSRGPGRFRPGPWQL